MVIVAGICVLLFAGCSKKASTPKEALKNMGEALREGDKDAFVACFDANEDQKKMLGAMCEFVDVTVKFEEAMIKAYGKDAVKGGKKSPLDEFKDDKWLDEVEIKIDGDKAIATKKDEKKPLNLVKKDGAWLISAGDMIPPDEMKDMDKALKMIGVMMKAVKDATGNIGKEGYTAERINQEIGAAMMKAIMENMGNQPPGGG